MAPKRILIIEDDVDIVELLRVNLTKEGYQVDSTGTGEEGIKLVEKNPPDLILLDIMLPGADGLEICKSIKSEKKTSGIPIIMLTAKSEDVDIVTGLEVGADDYITKPFSPKVVVARMRNVLRRFKNSVNDTSKIEIAGISIDLDKHQVKAGNKKLSLTPTEFGILNILARKPGWVFSRNQIVDEVRGDDTIITDRAVDVQVAGLRKKLGKYGDMIDTVRGVGYRFKETE